MDTAGAERRPEQQCQAGAKVESAVCAMVSGWVPLSLSRVQRGCRGSMLGGGSERVGKSVSPCM